MGFWMWLTRHDQEQVLALLDHPDGVRAGRDRLLQAWWDMPDEPEQDPSAALQVLEEVWTARTWDALHVLLTGCENTDDDMVPTGEAPARDVVMGGLVLSPDGGAARLKTPLLLTPDEVRAVHAHLQAVDRDALIRERHPLLREVGPYSFGTTAEPGRPDAEGDMVQNGSLARDFDLLRDFYARAAAGGDTVIKNIM
ncbi:hypothetical protein HDA32_002550 [Spinactinospora alkalitolerans]|uniref:DUF1877 domain-containing protein n=1 Tax=Spinactinospora alkalitolerans TaxID=687207 RepID=A0A852U080_9ACTN|nr:DUF1877 family protein [Spinactinospora alkalitolerans]NYE47430.1 hypothetical protein [Spinactinospora alkalitolerans]